MSASAKNDKPSRQAPTTKKKIELINVSAAIPIQKKRKILIIVSILVGIGAIGN